MPNRQKLEVILLTALIILSNIFLGSEASAGQVWLVAKDLKPFHQPAEVFETDIVYSSWDAAMGAFQIAIHYDSGVLTIMDVRTPSESGFANNTFVDTGSFGSGVTEIAGFQIGNSNDQTNPTVLLTMVWQVTGSSGSLSDIEIEAVSVVEHSLEAVGTQVYGTTTYIEEDFDSDGLADDWEQLIVNADPNDEIMSVEDVYPEDDFDGDGFSNLREFLGGSHPAYSDDIPACWADVFMDGDVDGEDLAIFVEDYLYNDCPCTLDMDGDENVDEKDLLFFSEDLGRTDCLEPGIDKGASLN